MILYFSGTGNSQYVAMRIGNEIKDETLNLLDKIKNRDFSDMTTNRPWVVVVPTYGWRIPRLVQKWLEQTNLRGNKEIYFVMTCGGSIGNAEQYLKKLCASKKMNLSGCGKIVMPENYIALFSTPTKEEAMEQINQAEEEITKTAGRIKGNAALPKPVISWKDRINSGIVNDIFYPVFVHANKFRVTDGCISCGRCVNVCPLNNIRLAGGKPSWGKDCTHCMACICRCPREAIEYGEHSKGQPRYICPKSIER